MGAKIGSWKEFPARHSVATCSDEPRFKGGVDSPTYLLHRMMYAPGAGIFDFKSSGCDNVTRQTVVNSSPVSQSREGRSVGMV